MHPRHVQRTLLALARAYPVLTALLHRVARDRANGLVRTLYPWLPATGRVLDIGAGTGHIAEALHRLGFAAVASDILDINFVSLPFVLADGAHLPFASASFDVSLLITMLHHTPAAAHIGLLQEATRVLRPGGRLLIIEDVYHGAFERKMTHIMDSMMNAEFVGHPHSNRSLAEWRALLQKLHLSLVHGVEYTAWYGPFRMRHALLVVAR